MNHDGRIATLLLVIVAVLVVVGGLEVETESGYNVAVNEGYSPLPAPTSTEDAGNVVALNESYDPLPTSTGIRQGNLLPQGFDRRAQTSKYMTGTVMVAVFLPESDGSGDPSTEDWTEASIARVVAEVNEAMTRYETLAPTGANLSFEIIYHVVPTSHEPITRDWENSGWRRDMMRYIKPSFTEKEYAEWLRTEHGTDWAFVLYIINSENDKDGLFPPSRRSLANSDPSRHQLRYTRQTARASRPNQPGHRGTGRLYHFRY